MVGSRNSKNKQHNGQRNGQTIIYKALHRKLKIEHHGTHKKGMTSGALKGSTVYAPLITPAVLLLSETNIIWSVPDLPLCLGVLKHRASLVRGASSSCQEYFNDGLLLMWCNFKFEGVLFRRDSRHNDRVDCFGAIPDIMIELIAYWSVSQSRQSWQWLSGIETKLLGASGYWQKRVEDGFMLTWCNFKLDGILFNLDTYRRMQ